ncbi:MULTISPECIES: extracellular solute-binding protein [unclassified Rhizobium]|uniref:extracellular solute-binding protein n=1 Tax=unclassified Rhizobium TaxID=2613769 RepID=UPI000BE9FB82|nr:MULTISPECIES: extracellular solute-binding protein [unclassified Rhizobium]PDT05994.1 ABC transporter substrate-binding protein [Rhizobium sp. M1]PDT29732.1 ABC transporter substrate-binding protein [Rhizobium sp. M10]
MTDKTSLSITRRQTLKFGGAALSASLFAPAVIRSAWAAEEPITLLTWETYDEPEWIAEWQAAHGTEIKPVIISSLDEVFAQLQSGAVKPDVIYSEASTAGRLKKAGQITPFDISKVPNISNILPGLNWREPLTVDGALMGIPLHWGTQPLQYNADAIKSAPTSWAALWDKTYQGKVTIFDDATVTIPMVALYVGAKNPFNLTEDEFTLVTNALRELRAQVRVVTRGFDDAANVYASGEAILGYCHNVTVVNILKKKGLNAKYSLPKEGTPAWIEGTFVTPKGQRDVVYKFLNDTMSAKWQARFMKFSGSNGVLTPVAAREAGLTEDELKNTNILDSDDPSFKDNLVFFKEPEDVERRIQLWNDFLAGTL